MTTTDGGPLEIRGPATGLLDDPFALRVRGAGPAAELQWRARYRDDDDRVWRAAAARAEDLGTSWSPAKEGTGAIAALRSLRPLSVDVRVETPDGRAAARTVTRLLAADGVRSRRWRDGLAATVHVPADAPCATVIVDATAGATHAVASAGDATAGATHAVAWAGDATAGATQAAVATLAASLLASRGVLALVVGRGHGVSDPLAVARERLAAVPGAGDEIVVLPALDPFGAAHPGSGVVLPPGVGARDARPGAAAERAAAWDALLARLGARPRAADQ